MPDINVAYEINQTVFHVSLTHGVREGVVRSAAVEITPTATNITYDIAFKIATSGSTEALEADLFSEIDAALFEYKYRVEAAV
jgi:hypothetical protein